MRENKFFFFNDTKRLVGIHPATEQHGTSCDMTVIEPLEVREFMLPEGCYPWLKMWDYGGQTGLQILVSPVKKKDGFGNDGIFQHQLDKGWMIALLTSGIDVELLKKAMYNIGYDDIDEPLKIIQDYLAKREDDV